MERPLQILELVSFKGIRFIPSFPIAPGMSERRHRHLGPQLQPLPQRLNEHILVTVLGSLDLGKSSWGGGIGHSLYVIVIA